MEKNSKIYVAGHTGLAGSAIVRELKKQGYNYLILRTHTELDLRNQKATEEFFKQEKPEYVFDAAARVGGLQANNTFRGEFIYDNLQIQNNIIHLSWMYKVKKLLFLGTNCMYPKECPQPMKEEFLFTGPLEPTNQPYAVAKLSGMEMCNAYARQFKVNFICAIPASLYGAGDNYDGINSHIIPDLIIKCHDAKINGKKEITLNGSKNRRREMLYSDDMANACLFLMNNYFSNQIINIGSGRDHSIEELVKIVSETVKYGGNVNYDVSKPDGMKQKFLDNIKISALGWKPKINMNEGIKIAYKEYKKELKRNINF